MLSSVEAIIFDFNGTLFDDSKFHQEAWTLFATKFNVILSQADFDNYIHGYTNKEILEYILQRKPEKTELDTFSEEKESIYRDICLDNMEKVILTPGAEDFLDYISNENIPRTIATASYLPNVKMFFNLFHLNRWFRFEHIIFDSGAYRGKPNPDLFLAASEKICHPIETCMIIEDSISGIQAANNAGAGVIIAVDFANNPHKFSEFDFIDTIISDFRQLI